MWSVVVVLTWLQVTVQGFSKSILFLVNRFLPFHHHFQVEFYRIPPFFSPPGGLKTWLESPNHFLSCIQEFLNNLSDGIFETKTVINERAFFIYSVCVFFLS